MQEETFQLLKKVIRQLLRISIVAHLVVGVILLFLSFLPQLGWLYIIPAFTITFFVAPLFFVFLVYIIYKLRRHEQWLAPFKKEVGLFLWTLLCIVFYYTCLYIGTEVI